MAYYDITAFDGVTIASTNVKQVSMVDTGEALTRVYVLENGAKFDADGTADADLALGRVLVQYQIVPTNNGMLSLDGYVATLEGLRGKHGTLTGKQYGTTTATKTCTARCFLAQSVEYTTADPPMSADRRQRAYFDLGWEKLTEWT